MCNDRPVIAQSVSWSTTFRGSYLREDNIWDKLVDELMKQNVDPLESIIVTTHAEIAAERIGSDSSMG